MSTTPQSTSSEERRQGRFGRVLFQRDGGAWALVFFHTTDGETIRVGGRFTEEDLRSRRVTLWGRETTGNLGSIFRVDRLWRGEGVAEEPPGPGDVESFAAEFFRGHHFGPTSAEKLVADLGEDAWAALTRRLDLLTEHVGDEDRAAELQGLVLEAGVPRAAALARLMGQGLTLAYARRVYRAMGADAVEQLAENPYRMVGVPGIGFATADRMAREGFGLERTDPRRLKALAVSVLESAAREGHTSMSEEDALAGILSLDDVQDQDLSAREILELAIDDGALARDMGDIYLPGMLRAERRAARGMAEMLLRPPRPLPGDFWADGALDDYTAEQKKAIAAGLTAPIVLISGRPGTGKTTVAREIVRKARDMEVPVTLSATTGKAADRLTEAITSVGPGGGRPGPLLRDVEPAQTLHSLVGYGRQEDRDLPGGIVVVDEASMLDLPLLARTLTAAGEETSLVFLGDPNQLPPVMAGNSSRDIRDSMVVPTLELTKVHRQDRNTLIAINADRILRGQIPLFYGDRIGRKALAEINDGFAGDPIQREDIDENAYFVDAGECEDGARRVVQVVRRLAERGYDPVGDVQVYTPMHGRAMGTQNLNRLLQAALNSGGEPVDHTDKRGLELRVGDPVIQTLNDKDGKGVVNGMRGVLAGNDGDGLRVRFNDGDVQYGRGEVRELAMAYAMTIHKGQGQEQPVSVLALHHSEHAVMLDRSLLYVGGTRAREMLIFVATRKALWMAMNSERGEQRRTRLAERTATRVRELRGARDGPQRVLGLDDRPGVTPLLGERASPILSTGPTPPDASDGRSASPEDDASPSRGRSSPGS